MHSEEAEIMSCAQSWDHQALFGQGGGRLLQDLRDLIQRVTATHPTATNRAEVGEFALVCGLHCGNGAALMGRGLHQLSGTADRRGADIDVIADHQEEGFLSRESSPAGHRMAVAPWFGLFDEAELATVDSRRLGVGRLVSRMNDHGDFFDAGREGFLDHHSQGAAGDAVLIHQGLQRQRALVAPGGGDQSLLDVHRFSDRGRTALPCQQEERG